MDVHKCLTVMRFHCASLATHPSQNHFISQSSGSAANLSHVLLVLCLCSEAGVDFEALKGKRLAILGGECALGIMARFGFDL